MIMAGHEYCGWNCQILNIAAVINEASTNIVLHVASVIEYCGWY